jgi:hypothetical protein
VYNTVCLRKMSSKVASTQVAVEEQARLCIQAPSSDGAVERMAQNQRRWEQVSAAVRNDRLFVNDERAVDADYERMLSYLHPLTMLQQRCGTGCVPYVLDNMIQRVFLAVQQGARECIPGIAQEVRLTESDS